MVLKKYWKKSSYKIKGLIIAILTFLILFIINLTLVIISTFYYNLENNLFTYFLYLLISTIIILPSIPFNNIITKISCICTENLCNCLNQPPYFITVFLSSFIIYIALGVLFGYLYEKNKSSIFKKIYQDFHKL